MDFVWLTDIYMMNFGTEWIENYYFLIKIVC